jgi:hypothetical protein
MSPGTPVRPWALLSIMILAFSVLIMPPRIGSMGYVPDDDANRHVGKALSGKPWNEILVLRQGMTADLHHGWDICLTFLHRRFDAGQRGLMAFSITFCFLMFAAAPMFFLRRPEAWLIAVGVIAVFDPFFITRYFLGRPFIIGCGVCAGIFFSWSKFADRQTRYRPLLVLTAVMAAVTWLLPTSAVLFGIPLLGFALAREWRVLVRLGLCIAAGSVAGYVLTGYPLRLAENVAFTLFYAPLQNIPARILVTEFWPVSGNMTVFIILAVLLLMRAARKRWRRQCIDNPLFINAVCGLLLGFVARRFWSDWGVVAAIAWIALEVEEILSEKLAFDSLRRFAFAAAISICLFLIVTSDVQNRWTNTAAFRPVSYDRASPEEKAWFPDSGGVVYNDEMGIFYRTFVNNADRPWRYILGFEPVLMPPEDLAVYRAIRYSNRSFDSYLPWVEKMRPCDRLFLTSFGAVPRIPGLEWYCMDRSVWIGRLPRTAAPGPVR